MSAPMRLDGKWLPRAEIPANWQRGCGLAPLCSPLILKWSVCQGDTLGPGINELLVFGSYPAPEDRRL